MKIILCGKNDAAVHCLRLLREHGDDVWAIGTHGDEGRDGWQKSFKAAARELQLPFDQPRKINDPDFVERLAAHRADLLISIQYDQILRQPLFDAIGCPCVNFHFALLPRHRGVAPIAWAVFEGDRQAGVSLHHMIENIDAGDLIAQKAVDIADDDTARDVYDKVSQATVELFQETHTFPPEQLAGRLAQDPAAASYHRGGDFDFSKRRIDWNQPAQRLHRWIRSMIFPPFQHPEISLNGTTWLVTRVGKRITPRKFTRPGTIMAASESGIDVAANDGIIRIRRLIDAEDRLVPQSELESLLPVGERLG